jgi:hypothetical protein
MGLLATGRSVNKSDPPTDPVMTHLPQPIDVAR